MFQKSNDKSKNSRDKTEVNNIYKSIESNDIFNCKEQVYQSPYSYEDKFKNDTFKKLQNKRKNYELGLKNLNKHCLSENLTKFLKSLQKIEVNKDEWLNNYRYKKSNQLDEETIKVNISDVSHLNNDIARRSVTVMLVSLCNLPFCLFINVWDNKKGDQKEYLSLQVRCFPQSISRTWSCTSDIEIKIKSFKNKDIVKSFRHIYKHDSNEMGFWDFIKWETLIDERNGFVKDKKFTIEVNIKIINVTGIREKPLYDFTQPGNVERDIKLIIDGIDIYVNKDYLSIHSPIFERMLNSDFDESRMFQYLSNINIDDFIQLLEVIYPVNREITEENVGILLELGIKFEISYVLDQCEKFLCNSNRIPLELLLFYSDIYRLQILQSVSISKICSLQNMKEISNSEEFSILSDDLKATLFDKYVDLFKSQQL
uniref:BTB domain-containing protein n=1 Tax=Parastrongyloides trichosuri TaxID=131310 RepID=A0A0N4ZNA8_PARTI